MGESSAPWPNARIGRKGPRCPPSPPRMYPTGTDDQTENGRTVEDSRSPQRPAVPFSESQAVFVLLRVSNDGGLCGRLSDRAAQKLPQAFILMHHVVFTTKRGFSQCINVLRSFRSAYDTKVRLRLLFISPRKFPFLLLCSGGTQEHASSRRRVGTLSSAPWKPACLQLLAPPH